MNKDDKSTRSYLSQDIIMATGHHYSQNTSAKLSCNHNFSLFVMVMILAKKNILDDFERQLQTFIEYSCQNVRRKDNTGIGAIYGLM